MRIKLDEMVSGEEKIMEDEFRNSYELMYKYLYS
jgi:hypothetical protein